MVDGMYRVAGAIGGGAMGVVFLAVDVRLDRNVALKLIRTQLINPAFRALFRQEARAMALVNHPNVITIYSFGEHEGVPYFAMELVQGKPLDRILEQAEGELEQDLALRLLDQACLGLSAIHEVGAVHRDIKPANLLVDAQWRLRIGDLGLAASLRDDCNLREVVGTPGYIAPEILLREGDATPQSDLYSLACVAYEVLVGVAPFACAPGEAPTVEHLAKPIPLPSSLRPSMPAAFDQVLLSALAADPKQRTATVEDFRLGLLEARTTSLDPARILIVEDDVDERLLLELALEAEFPRAELECVGDGAAALAAFARKPASVVVSDLQMPDVDGLTLTRWLRERPDANAVPIVLLTASGGPGEWRRLSSLGADRFVVKPANVEDLASSIRSALRERRAAQR